MPSLNRDQVREFDRRAIEEWGIPGVVLMENAGRQAAEVALQMLGEHRGSEAVILCGAGNNGGDGFVVARHLMRAGVDACVYLAVDVTRLTGDAGINCEIWSRLGGRIVPVTTAALIDAAAQEWLQCGLIVDGLLGTGFRGELRSPFDGIIRAVGNIAGARVLALDVPSGLDCDTGRPGTPTIRADTTVTFVARKTGFDVPGVEAYTGRVLVADIGVPYI